MYRRWLDVFESAAGCDAGETDARTLAELLIEPTSESAHAGPSELEWDFEDEEF